ncbi:hypothetical protein CASFOL_017030 [Castilleja foliolosa]|uniref:CTLH domain-containing protein n=1 Tax=Castilleja foliolosa TaxID=1961234 RepID=A0ABD3DAF2_9LAMI
MLNRRSMRTFEVNDDDINKIVQSYLVHNCFNKTLESFVEVTGEKQPVSHLENMEKRKSKLNPTLSSVKGIYNLVLEGNVSKAIELMDQYAPDLLKQNEDLHFDLLGLRYVELEAVTFAQLKLTPFDKDQNHIQKIEDFITLLAYHEPDKSPIAILEHSKLPSYSVMERVIQQTAVVRQYLSQEFGKDGHHQPFSLKDFLKS